MTTEKLMVSLAAVEHEIISAIEETTTPDGMGEQSDIWSKVYKALDKLKEQATPLKMSSTFLLVPGCSEAEAIHAVQTNMYPHLTPALLEKLESILLEKRDLCVYLGGHALKSRTRRHMRHDGYASLTLGADGLLDDEQKVVAPRAELVHEVMAVCFIAEPAAIQLFDWILEAAKEYPAYLR